MRFSSFLLPLALLLSLQLVSADNQTSLIGTWTNPLNTTDMSEYCCIPTSIQIENNGTDLLAIYKYPGLFDEDYNPKCFALFLTLDSGNMTLNLINGSSDSYYSETGLFGNITYDYQLINGSKLNVFIDSLDPADGCNFTMKAKDAPLPNFSFYYPLIFFGVIFLAFLVYKNCQKKKPAINNQKNLAQPAAFNPVLNHAYMVPNNVYVPPNNIHVAPHNVLLAPNNGYVTSNNVNVPPNNAFVVLNNVNVGPNNVNMAPNNVHLAPNNAQVGINTRPENKFVKDYPKFI